MRQQTMKKLCALVLTAVLAAAGLPALTAPAQAATDEATTVVMANDYGTVWTLQDGETKEGRDEAYTASYADGVLTLTDASGSDNVGCHEITTACYASIYADGNLTIRFEGDRNSCTFNLGALEMGEAVQSYGIYVKGNLTIINGQCNTGTRTIKFAPTKDAPPTQRSAGIYCEGSLTIANESEDGFYLIAEAAGVEATDGNVGSNFFNYGIYAAGAITIGGYCTVEATAADVALSTYNGSTHSYGVSCDNGDLTLEQDATLHATAGDINANDNWERVSLSNYQYSRGIYVPGGGVKVNKGSILTATGGNITFDEEGTLTGSTGGCLGSESYGIYSGSVTMNGYKLTAKAGSVNTTIGTTYSISQGIHTGTLTVSAGTLTAAADDAWKESIGIWATSNITQTGGAITSTGGVAICSGDVGTGSRGVFVAGTLTASAGTLTATGGQMGNKIPTVGLIANSVSLSGTAQVTGIGGDTMKDTGCVPNTSITGEGGFGSYPGDSIGVQLFDDFTVDDSAVLTGIGGTITSAENAAAEAKSVGLRIETADAVTVTGSGTVSATGGETTRGSKSANTFVDTSYGIYGDLPALTVSGTNISATGGDVCTKHFVNDYYNGGLSYGLYLVNTDTSSLTLTDGAKITATGGENANYSTTFDRVPKYNDSYGAYVKGDITLTDSTLSATGGLSQRVCGLSCTGAVTLNGLTSRLDAVAGDYHSDAAGTDWSYGFISGESEALPGGNLTVNRGAFTARGQSDALEYQLGTNTVTSTVIMAGSEWDGSNATKRTSPQRFNQFYGVNYLRADSANVYVTVSDWAYGDTASTLSYTAYEGDASVSWSGTTAGGTAYSGTEPPTKVGDYTVTVTYSTGETGSANVKVTPRQISWCNISLVEGSIYPYTGEAKTFGIRVSNGETLLVEDIDYTLEDDTATDAGTYTMIVTGKGSYTGTHPIEYYISRAVPTTDDFLIREIEARDYTGEPIVVEPPELAPPKTGMGEVTIRYNGETTPPTNAGEYTVTFDVADGKNYAAAAGLEYGTLVIGKIDNPMELKADAVEVFTGDTVDLKDYITNLGGDAAVISLPEEPNDCALGCTLENGVLTAGDVTGEFTVRVRAPGDVNYNSAEASITVTVAQKLIPTVTAQPANQTAASGTKATFTVGASGTGLTYQWQWKGTTSTSQWANTNLSGFNTENLTVNATSTVNGRQYRCIVTGANGESVTSEAATLTLLEITAQPEAQTAASGAKATFTVEASGSGLTYQWQYSANGGSTWSNTTLSGYNTATLAVTASSAVNGRQYRCIVTGTNGSTVTSEGAKLTVGTALKITAQPEAQTVASGAKATFTVGASGTGLEYQWQYSANGGSTWGNTTLSGYNTATLTVTASSAVNGRQYRCIVTDGSGNTVTSDGAKLTLAAALKITAQPEDQNVASGEKATFTVGASGTGLTYQWQYSANGGSTWANTTLSGYNTATLKVTASSNVNGRQYRCVVTDGSGNTVTSDGAKLTLAAALKITAQPKAQTVASGEKATFTVGASGTGLTYQWQYSANGGSTWSNTTLSGYNTATLKVTASSTVNGRQYRCVVTDSSGNTVTSDGAKLTLAAALKITSQPEAQTVASGEKATFTVAASGSGLEYQWQYSANGGSTWSNTTLSGYNTATLKVTASSNVNGRQYRCIVTDGSGNTVTSDGAKLTLAAALKITSQPEAQTVASGEKATFTVSASGSGLEYQWQYSANGGSTWSNTTLSGYNTATLKVTASSTVNGRQYRCIVTDANGDTVTSDGAKLTVG